MSKVREALELPPEPPRQWHGAPQAAGVALSLIAAGVVLARTFALGGWERPWLVTGVVVILPAMLGAWLAAGPIERRTPLVVAAMVLGIVALPFAVSGATPSTGRLADLMDAMRFPGTVERDVAVGNARCRPACSELRRTMFVDDIAFAKARSGVINSLRFRGFQYREYGRVPGAPLRIDAERGKLKLSIELRELDLTRTRIALVLIADGPAPDYEVGLRTVQTL